MSTLTVCAYRMPAAALGRQSPLPDLKETQDAHARIDIDETTVTPEEAKYMGYGRIDTILPYTVQDGYDRSKRPRNFKAFVLENENLRATFLPQLGGRLWSLYDKQAERELLHVNPVFQPCNLALRNAWISGGVEWNAGIIGHTPFTVDDMACQTLKLSDGTPVLRMFQYERVRRIFYRVEAFLPDGARELFVRVRIDNARREDTCVYWWSNMAVNEGTDVRVIVPAEKAFRYGYGGKLAKVPVPYMRAEADKLRGEAAQLARANGGYLDWDISHSTELPQSMDFFFDIRDNKRPFIAALDKEGFGMCQTSTGELRGRKLFVWGMGTGGRHWQTFLAEEGCAYIELQAGLARTQLEHLPMRAGQTISWLESYGALKANPAVIHGKDYGAAIAEAECELERLRPAQTLVRLHEQVKRELDGQNGKVIHRGMGFARVEKALLGEQFSTAGLSLAAMRMGARETPWMSLAKSGALPCPPPLAEIASFQTGTDWERALSASIASGKSNHWYGHYHLGVMLAARHADTDARECFERSLAHTTSPWALAGLATLDARKGDIQSAANRLCQAVALKPERALAMQALDALAKSEQYERLLSLLGALPVRISSLGRAKTYAILALTRTGRYAEAEKLLEGSIVLTDVREGDVLLSDLWYELQARKEYGNADAPAMASVREKRKPPAHLDFRML